MNRFSLDNPEVGLVQHNEPQDKYKVVVTFTVRADSADDAEISVKDIIEQGILGIIDIEEKEPIHEWDIIEAELAEIF